MFYDLRKNKILYLNDRHEEADTEGEDRQKLYDKRIFPLLDRNDLAVFGERIDPFLWDYYRGLGLASIDRKNIFYVEDYLQYSSLTKAVIKNHSMMEGIKKRRPDRFIPYIISKDTQYLSRRINCHVLSDFEAVEYINNKANYREIIQKLDFPIIPGFRAINLKEAKMHFNYLKNNGFNEIVIKKERSVAGFGVFIIRTEKELEDLFKTIFIRQKSFLLEAFIEDIKIASNAQYWIGPKEIKFITLSDQLFEKDRVSHKGNKYPSLLDKMPAILRKVKKYSLRLCRYLQSQNNYGLIGIDYLITKDGDIYSNEANYRLNYSTFPALIVKKLFGSAHHLSWKTFTIRGHSMSFEELFRYSKDIFITKKGDFGIFPIDIGILKSKSEGQFMAIAPTLKQVYNYKNKLGQNYENLSYRNM